MKPSQDKARGVGLQGRKGEALDQLRHVFMVYSSLIEVECEWPSGQEFMDDMPMHIREATVGAIEVVA